jgi:hypothetical protein
MAARQLFPEQVGVFANLADIEHGGWVGLEYLV